MNFQKTLINLFRRPLTKKALLWMFVHMNFALPVHRIIDSPDYLAFHHPEPAYPLHILLVPKREISSFSALTDEDDPLILELMHAAQSLVHRYGLADKEYRIIINGGSNQEVPIFHIHLISDSPITYTNEHDVTDQHK